MKRKIKNGTDKGQPYLCCNRNDHKGCRTLPTHLFAPIHPNITARYVTSAPTPSPNAYNPKRAAVALDCEMVTVLGEWREVAHIAAVDYLTGETLLNTLVAPTVEVIDWNTQITGMSAAKLQEGLSTSSVLPSWIAARSALWEFIDSDTVLVGQSLQFDLEVLGMIHPLIADSEIITTRAVDLEGGRRRGLKELCKELLNLNVQGREHDALEDAMAARELLLFLCGQPAKVKAWAKKARKQEGRRKEGERKRKDRKKEKEKSQTYTRRANWDDDDDDYVDWFEYKYGMTREEMGYPSWYDDGGWSD